jgi:hypothetical protein
VAWKKHVAADESTTSGTKSVIERRIQAVHDTAQQNSSPAIPQKRGRKPSKDKGKGKQKTSKVAGLSVEMLNKRKELVEDGSNVQQQQSQETINLDTASSSDDSTESAAASTSNRPLRRSRRRT